MKAKKIKKLTLNKATIVNLNNEELGSAKGGAPTIDLCTHRMCTRPFMCDTEADCDTYDLC